MTDYDIFPEEDILTFTTLKLSLSKKDVYKKAK